MPPASPTTRACMQFLATRPWIANAFKITKYFPYPVSFAQTVFHAIHAFRFVNAADEAQYARYHWEPEAGEAGQTLEELQKQPPSYLFEVLEERLKKHRWYSILSYNLPKKEILLTTLLRLGQKIALATYWSARIGTANYSRRDRRSGYATRSHTPYRRH